MGDRPVIVIVDDRPHGLTALRDAVARRYAIDYRVLAYTSAADSLAELSRARDRGEEVALVIADQWMPEMTGRELLERAHALHPGAQRALLVGWGDTRATTTILQGCARGQLDNYILKPWAPPEVHLYPVIGEFLAEWTRQHRPRLELVRADQRDALAARHRAARPARAQRDPARLSTTRSSTPGRELMRAAPASTARDCPRSCLLDGRVLHDPSNAELAEPLGVSELDDPSCDLQSSAPARAALGCSGLRRFGGPAHDRRRARGVGGQASASSLIRNFLGFPRGITGAELAQRAYQQAWLFGAKYVLARDRAAALRRQSAHRRRLDDGREIAARAVIIATGAEYRRLGVPRIERFDGMGVLYTAGADVALALRGEDSSCAAAATPPARRSSTSRRPRAAWFTPCAAPALCTEHVGISRRRDRRLPNVELRLEHRGRRRRRASAASSRSRCAIAAAARLERSRTLALFVMIGARAAHRLARRRRRARSQRLHPDRRRSARGTRASRSSRGRRCSRDQHARRVRSGRRSPRLDQAPRLGGR